MNTGKLLTLGLVGGVGYWLYKQYETGTGLFASSTSGGGGSTGGNTSGGTDTSGGGSKTDGGSTTGGGSSSSGAGTTPTITIPAYQCCPNSGTTDAFNIFQKFTSYVSVNGLASKTFNTDQWNWYFTQATGKAGPAPEDVGVSPRDALMNWNSYQALITRWLDTGKGVSGMAGYYRPGRAALRLAPNYVRAYR